MISTRRLLKYIDKHPNCSYLEIASKLFNNNIELTSSELKRIKNYIIFKAIFHIDDDGRAISVLDHLHINTEGKQYLETIFKDKWRFRIPLIISIIALIFSALSYFHEIANPNTIIEVNKIIAEK